MIRKAIFDMDGLIFNSERLFMNCLIAQANKFGYSITEEIYVNTLGLAKPDCKKYMQSVFGNDYPFDEISNLARKEIVDLSKNGLPVKDGIRELLDFLHADNIECVVASSSETKYIRIYLDNSGLGKYFSQVIGGETVENSKPSPDIFLKALGDTPKYNAVIFEDSENGIIAAHRAGIRVICIPDMKMPCDEILSYTALCVDTAADVIGTEIFK